MRVDRLAPWAERLEQMQHSAATPGSATGIVAARSLALGATAAVATAATVAMTEAAGAAAAACPAADEPLRPSSPPAPRWSRPRPRSPLPWPPPPPLDGVASAATLRRLPRTGRLGPSRPQRGGGRPGRYASDHCAAAAPLATSACTSSSLRPPSSESTARVARRTWAPRRARACARAPRARCSASKTTSGPVACVSSRANRALPPSGAPAGAVNSRRTIAMLATALSPARGPRRHRALAEAALERRARVVVGQEASHFALGEQARARGPPSAAARAAGVGGLGPHAARKATRRRRTRSSGAAVPPRAPAPKAHARTRRRRRRRRRRTGRAARGAVRLRRATCARRARRHLRRRRGPLAVAARRAHAVANAPAKPATTSIVPTCACSSGVFAPPPKRVMMPRLACRQSS